MAIHRASSPAYPVPRRLHDEPHASEVAKRAFFQIMAAWNVTDRDARILLGAPSKTTFYAWKKGEGGKLSRDTFERISYVLGIYKALQILFPNPERADGWITRANEAFSGASALERMLGGNISDLHAVRSYLDHVRGGLS